MKTTLSFLCLTFTLLVVGCSSMNHGFDRGMDYKEKVADSKTGNAAIAMGGHYQVKKFDEEGNVTQTETWSATPLASEGTPQSAPVPQIKEPSTEIPGGGTLRFGTYIENVGTEPIHLDASTLRAMMGQSLPAPFRNDRDVTPTEKLAMLTAFYGEDGRFVPKDAFTATGELAVKGLQSFFLYDIANNLIDYSQTITTSGIEASTAQTEAGFNFAENFEPFVVPE